MHTKLLAAAALAAALLAAGCPPPKAIVQEERIDLAECIARHNENAERVEHLWIHCGIDFQMHRPGKLPLLIGLDGLLIYRPPRELVLKGDVFGETQVFYGSNPNEYWMWSRREDTLYFGTWAKFGTPGTAMTAIPAPEVFWMLGIYPIRGTPILSYTRDDRYRYVRFHDIVGGRQLRVLRELVLDRIDHWEVNGKTERAFEKDRVVKVRTYSLDGTLMVEASCNKYTAFSTETGEVLLPTEFTIEVRQEHITLKIKLDEAELPEALTREIKDAYFAFVPGRAPVSRCIDLDEGGKQVPCE